MNTMNRVALVTGSSRGIGRAVAAQLARAALCGAVMNIYINTKSMKDREYAEKLNAHTEEMLKNGSAKADAIFEAVKSGLR